MGTRTEYFCDLCENPRPFSQLAQFVLENGGAEVHLLRVIAGHGDKHICTKCLAIVFQAVRNADNIPEQGPCLGREP